MVDTKKEQERDELHRAIWSIADELRGAVDGWDFKNYVLGTMFYRYISENLCNYINNGEADAGNIDFDFSKMSDSDAEEAREGHVEEKGFFILPSELFCNVRANAASDENLNETLERVFRHIEESAMGSEAESNFAGLFDDYDVNSNKLGATVAKRNEKLVKLLNGVAEMNLGDVKEHSIDAFGDAYEYLMTMYALNSYVAERREHDLNTIITEEKLRPVETRRFIENAFRDGEIKTSGTDIDKIMPPISRFGGGGRAQKKQGVIDKLKLFFEKYFGIGGSPSFDVPEDKTIAYIPESTLGKVAEPKSSYGEQI